MEIALVGLAGVVIGAAMTVGGNFLLDRRREEREFRKAARLIVRDLRFFIDVIGFQVERGKGWIPAEWLPEMRWQMYEDVLAAHISDQEDWKTIEDAFVKIPFMLIASEQTDPNAEATDDDLAVMRLTALTLGGAGMTLDRYLTPAKQRFWEQTWGGTSPKRVKPPEGEEQPQRDQR